MPGISLYNFQRNPMLDQVHTEAVTERVAGNRDTKVTESRFARSSAFLIQLRGVLSLCTGQSSCCLPIRRVVRNSTHLPDILRIGQRNKTEHLFILARPSAATLTLFGVFSRTNGREPSSLKAGAGQRQRLINTRARVPEGIERTWRRSGTYRETPTPGPAGIWVNQPGAISRSASASA